MRAPRVMLAAPASGSGKTLVTCGILQLLHNRGIRVASFKCGPDYIDPMFHGRVLGIPSRNLDTFFTDEETTRYLFVRGAREAELSVIEGVMGFYDGVAGISTQASAYDLARVTRTPVILVVDVRGMSVSAAALIRGFLQHRADSRIAGVILNRVSAGLYPRMKQQIEGELPVKVLGYVPESNAYVIESRHLGLVTPGEIMDLQQRLQRLSEALEETLDVNGLLELAAQAEEICGQKPQIPRLTTEDFCPGDEGSPSIGASASPGSVKIGITQDEAFCFYYQDNLALLEEMGAQLCCFSPLEDSHLPEGIQGLIFYGGYPELYAQKLAQNHALIAEIRSALDGGMPYLAECGGFMYLHETMEDLNGQTYPMVGAVQGHAFQTKKLGRFGYITLEAQKDQLLGARGAQIRGHEFHYFDSTDNGKDFHAAKPLAKREWDCMHADQRRAVGFPHLYYYSNPQMAFAFVKKCASFSRAR